MTIEELLNNLVSKTKATEENVDRNLPNTKSIWERIGAGDDFSELGFTSESEKESFLKEWIEKNPYSETK